MREISKAVQFLTVVPKLKGILIQFQNAVTNKLLIPATTWNLKSLMLSKRNLPQKPTYFTIPFIWHSRKDRTIKTEITCGCWGWNRGRKLIAKGHKATFWGDENILCFDCGGGCETEHVCQNLSNCVPQTVTFTV